MTRRKANQSWKSLFKVAQRQLQDEKQKVLNKQLALRAEAGKHLKTLFELDKAKKCIQLLLKQRDKYRSGLKAAYECISALRGQISDINLLNGKLLYTNKLFKEFENLLDDGFRMKIVEDFDLTKSIREVKLVYALFAESLWRVRQSKEKELLDWAMRKHKVKTIDSLFRIYHVKSVNELDSVLRTPAKKKKRRKK